MEIMQCKNGTILHCIPFKLGEIYYIRGNKSIFACKFIQVTRFGYNFLNLSTNQCILSRHVYIPKKYRDKVSDVKRVFTTLNQSYFIDKDLISQWISNHEKNLSY